LPSETRYCGARDYPPPKFFVRTLKAALAISTGQEEQ
jgi:hypothetical protein